ncbi:MAG: PEP-utilizing enzyme [Armatimonadota bacterium]|nr:PEP-utilizing enzyme [Armatimonadota bacterium]MDR7443852.1 PEP-utilizing enzyme [Armatimonadota bacterium]MDR7568980.1 PEP-utilizing enzyme [Armatimonadota bacterium]MDR7615503.1 PEP-utilizing enzyme [Armatimonadota bacterium]
MSAPLHFPSPRDVPTPPGAEGWEELYPYYLRFGEEWEEQSLWLFGTIHFAEVLAPFDAVMVEATHLALGQMNSRTFAIPPAMGIAARLLNGYLYISPIPVADPQKVQERVKLFQSRAGYYYANWNRIYTEWKEKVRAEIERLKAFSFENLPEVEPESFIVERRGYGSSLDLLVTYHRLVESVFRVWQYHMEIVIIGFAAYFTFYEFCKKAFPEISDQAITQMVGAIDVTTFRPNEELKRLARRAVELGVDGSFDPAADVRGVFQLLEQTEAGRAWLEEWRRTSDPWFYMNTGDGLQHHFRAWVDDPEAIFGILCDYVAKVKQGEPLERDVEGRRRERDQVTEGYRALLQTEEDRKAFDELLRLVRDVYYAIEDHQFYVEHWYQSTFWNKVRELGRLLTRQRILQNEEDIFYLHWTEVHTALVDMLLGWAIGVPARGGRYWPRIVDRRRAVLERLRTWTPLPALGQLPEAVVDPAVVMLGGITPERLREWAEGLREEGKVLRGIGASPGTAEGTARVVLRTEQLEEVQEGEILVCYATQPSWTPVLSRVRGTVTDAGGLMSHAAIVAREFGIPAVLGTGSATKRIRTGQRIRIDGDAGVVTILD